MGRIRRRVVFNALHTVQLVLLTSFRPVGVRRYEEKTFFEIVHSSVADVAGVPVCLLIGELWSRFDRLIADLQLDYRKLTSRKLFSVYDPSCRIKACRTE